MSQTARAYSTGNRQKVALVAAFATRAPVLILDEPTSGLDPLMERAFRASIDEARDRSRTVFLSSHQLAEVEAVCDRVGILRAGRLVGGGRASGAAPAPGGWRSTSASQGRRQRWRCCDGCPEWLTPGSSATVGLPSYR